MDDQLKSLGIEYERSSAIYGKDIDHSSFIDANKSFKVEGRMLSPGDIGTALSHRTVYDLIISGGYPYALILEDDVKLPEKFREIVERELRINNEKGDKGWEYLAFDYGPIGLELFPIWFRSFGPLLQRSISWMHAVSILSYGLIKFFYICPMFFVEILRDKFRRYYPGSVIFYRPMYNAGAYIVTQKGAQKLRKLATPIYCTSDRLHNQARIKEQLRIRWYAPACVRQVREEFGSTASEQVAESYKDKTAYVK